MKTQNANQPIYYSSWLGDSLITRNKFFIIERETEKTLFFRQIGKILKEYTSEGGSYYTQIVEPNINEFLEERIVIRKSNTDLTYIAKNRGSYSWLNLYDSNKIIKDKCLPE